MVTSTSYVGVDVSKAKLDVAVLQEERQYHAIFDNSKTGLQKLKRWLTKRTDLSAVQVCLEATGHYGDALAETLHEAGYQVSVVNPARIKAFADSRLSRQKTDKADAQLIALFCQSQQPEPWTPPDPAQKELQALVRHLNGLKAMRQQQLNRLESVTSSTVAQTLHDHIAFLDAQIAQLAQHIRDHIDQHPALKQQRDLLISIPGLGDTTIATLLGEIRDIRAFDKAGELAAYAGVTPQQHRSGSSVHRRTHISKRGNARLRAALYFPAMVAMRHNPLLRTFAQRLLTAGHPPISVVVAVMRKLLHLVFGILKSGQLFDPHYLVKAQVTA